MPETPVPETPVPDANQDNVLIAQNLEVSYGATQVLWGISFTVARGKVTCIIGSNGAGKTTALNTIAGVLQLRKGSIELNGQDLAGLSTRERVKRHLSLVPEGRQLWPGMSVEENLLMGCFLPALRPRAHTNLARIYDQFPRLKERRHQMAGTLSGGEQQMCAIGRALMSAPRLLLLDEPSAGLAPVLVEQVFDLVKRIRARGLTVLIVEQNVQQVLRVIDRAYLLKAGSIRASGTAAELQATDTIREAYLGV